MNELTHVGFTGTRTGLTSRQRHTLRIVLAELHNDGAIWFHHGDCEGADEEAQEVAIALAYFIHVHPPDSDKFRADDRIYALGARRDEPAPYMVRNQAIVDTCAILIACPNTTMRIGRSGTWSTVRKAGKKGIPRIIVYPDGTVERE